jgi:hypothetical protein
MRSQTRPVRLWRFGQERGSNGTAKTKGRPEGSYRLPIVVPLLTVERPREAPEGGLDRRLWCRRYDRCLTYAAALGWTGFACGECPVDDEISAAERLIEAARIKRFVAEVKL